MKKFIVAQRELMIKSNKKVNYKKLLNVSMGRNNVDYISKTKTLNYDNIIKIECETNEINKEIKIYNVKFRKSNKNRAKIILYNKQYNLLKKIRKS